MSRLLVAVTEEMASELVGAENFLTICCLQMSNGGREQGTDLEVPLFHVCWDNGVDGSIGYSNTNWFSRSAR